ncbi:hypothetical protein [Mesorhizobium sp. M00.F.Ca.ET.216.01.1.1]|nr:hypothetical protein [Mesorhizobium sp. M00.F.Ca.ET.216.01.1.1]
MTASLIAELRAACPNTVVWDSAELASHDRRPQFQRLGIGSATLKVWLHW